MEESNQPKKVFWTKSKIIVAIAIVTSWAPFYGYTYLNGYVAGAGFEADYIHLPIQEAVYYFLIGISDIWQSELFFNKFYYYMSVEIGIGVTLISIFLLRVNLKSNYVQSKGKCILKSLQNNWYSTISFSLITGLIAALFILAIPILVWGSLGLMFLVAIAGNPIGIKHGNDVLAENHCIYGSPESNCTILKAGDSNMIGHSLYMNDKYIYFISSKGRYQTTLKGEIVMYKPFSLNFIINVPDSIKFNNDEWKNNIASRVKMLESFWSEKPKAVTGEYVLRQLGKSDVTFHYAEFPAYKLSEIADCKVAFPFDWVSNEVVNVVFSGNCKGII